MELLLGIRCQVINMRKVIANNRRRSKRGTTLVELIVSLTLTAMFAVICVMLINPIERTYQHTEKTVRAQLLADTIVDSIRKECDGIKNDDINSVWIANGSFDADSASDQILFNPDCSKRISSGLESNNKGTVLVIKKNNSYCEMIFASLPITNDNKTEANNNVLDGTYSGHAVDELFQGSAEDVAKNTGRGVVHFGYYGAGDKGNGVYPLKAYDYTNPLIASTYGDYHVKVYFQKLVTRTEEINGVEHEFPSFVEMEVKVYEGEYKAGENESNLVYTRKAAIAFSANGSRHGTSHAGSSSSGSSKNIEVNVKWQKNNGASLAWPENVDSVTISVMSNSIVKGSHTLAKPKKGFYFSGLDVNSNIEILAGAVNGYVSSVTGNVANGFTVTYRQRKVDNVKLISGPSFNSTLKKDVSYVIFGSYDQFPEDRFPELIKGKGAKVAIDINATNDNARKSDYELFRVKGDDGKITAYILSEDGSFIANESCKNMFFDCKKLENITDIKNVNTYLTKDMTCMFKNCRLVEQFDLPGFVTGTCEVMEGMFDRCFSVNYINMSDWNTENVWNMNWLFHQTSTKWNKDGVVYDPNPMELDISNFSFKNCTDAKFMFGWDERNTLPTARKITKIILPDFDETNNTSKIRSMEGMFASLTDLVEIENLENMRGTATDSCRDMFRMCYSLETIDLSSFDTEKCTTMEAMFEDCHSVVSCNLSGVKTGKVKNMAWMFTNFCGKSGERPITVDITKFDFSSCTDMNSMFASKKQRGFEVSNDRNIANVIFPGSSAKEIDIGKVKSIKDMFVDGKGIRQITNFKNIRFDSLTDAASVFKNCSSITQLDISNWYCPKLKTINSIFSGCSSLQHLIAEKFDMPACTDASYMFEKSNALVTVNLDKWNLSSITTLSGLLQNKGELKRVSISDSTNNVQNLSRMLSGCRKLEYAKLDGFVNYRCNTIAEMFRYCSSLTDLDISEWDTSGVGFMNYTFSEVGVENFDISHFRFNSITDMNHMFYLANASTITFPGTADSIAGPARSINMGYLFENCRNLKKVNGLVGCSFLPKVISAPAAFSGCTALESIDLSDIDLRSCTDMSRFFANCSILENVKMEDAVLSSCNNLNNMFSACNNLKVIDFDRIDLRSAESLGFLMLNPVRELYMSHADIRSVSSLSKWHYNKDRKLEIIDLSYANASSCKDLSECFRSCPNLKNANFSGADFSKCETTSLMFSDCKKLEGVYMRAVNLNNNTTTQQMFENCYCVEVFDLKDWNTPKVTNMSKMFHNACYFKGNKDGAGEGATKECVIDISSFDFRNVETFESMLDCETTAHYESGGNTNRDYISRIVLPQGEEAKALKCVTARWMFRYRQNVKSIDNLEYLTTGSSFTNAHGMFSRVGCKELDIRNLDFSHLIVNYQEGAFKMFDNCLNLTKIYVKPGTDYSGTSIQNVLVFHWDPEQADLPCHLVGGAGTAWSTTNVNGNYMRIDDPANGKPGYFTDYHDKESA